MLCSSALHLSTMTELLPLLTYCFVMSSTPGPNNVMLTASGANFGYRASLPHILGIGAGTLVQTWLSCLGLGALFQAYPVLHQLLRVAGALYLLFLAWQLCGARLRSAALPRPVTFSQAALFQAVNPKSWLKAVTLASVFMPPGFGLLAGAAIVSAVGVAVTLPCVSVWALFGVGIRRVLTDPGKLRAFNACLALTLVALAAAFFR